MKIDITIFINKQNDRWPLTILYMQIRINHALRVMKSKNVVTFGSTF